MENKNELLEKLGFSQEYLKCINSDSQNRNFRTIENPINLFFDQINSNDLTSLIIDKSSEPMNKNFIYNQK
jgi:hypothetical protein